MLTHMPSTPDNNSPPSDNTKPPVLTSLLKNGELPLALCAIALLIQLGGNEASLWLRYDREGILDGEVWRIITGHLVHLGWPHLLMNLTGLILIWLLFGHLIKRNSWLIIFIISTIGISAGMMLFNPELKWYVGLSGVLHGMFVAGAIVSIKAGYRAEWLLLLLLTGKLAWEQMVGPLPGSAEFAGGNVIVDAHLYGAISGLLISLALIIYHSSHRQTA
ncbi:MAG: rhombosortase [Gammaproteobacteria bacterium]|nr:rhombosortase [Gammaproteobacteria bacterium]